jgi:hypothetical protein
VSLRNGRSLPSLAVLLSGVLCLVLPSFEALSAPIVWTDAIGDHNWFNAANWSPNVIPNSTNEVVINGGVVEILPPEDNPHFALLTLNGATVSGVFTNFSELRWSGGVLSNCDITISTGAVLHIVGDANKILSRSAIRNSGIVLWTGSGAIVGDDHPYENYIYNDTNGLFEAQSDTIFGVLRGETGWLEFNNDGIFRKSGGTNGTISTGTFIHSGTVESQTGFLDFKTGLNRPMWPPLHGTFSGNGEVRLSGPIYGVFDGRAVFAEGLLSGAFTNAGSLTWRGGTLSNCTMVVASGASLEITGADAKAVYDSIIMGYGTTTWIQSDLIAATGNTQSRFWNRASGVFEVISSGNFNVPSDSANRGWFDFTNDGVFRKANGPNTLVFGRSTGFENSGTLNINQGRWHFANSLRLLSSAVIEVAFAMLGAPQQSPPLSIEGELLFDGGTLVLTGSQLFHPQPGESFSVLSAGSARVTWCLSGCVQEVGFREIRGNNFDDVVLVPSYGPFFVNNFASGPITLTLTAVSKSVPIFVSTFRHEDSSARVMFSTLPNTRFQVQASDNLMTWETIVDRVATVGFYDFFLNPPNPESPPYRFYRGIIVQ